MWMYLWIGILVVSIIVEALTVRLTAIWISFGALVAWLAAWLNVPVWIQCLIFVVVAALLLSITRPLVMRYLTPKKEKTNVDAVPGKRGVVLSEIRPVEGVGQVKIEGVIWSAKPEDGASRFYPGDPVEVVRVEGVKAVVRRIPAAE